MALIQPCPSRFTSHSKQKVNISLFIQINRELNSKHMKVNIKMAVLTMIRFSKRKDNLRSDL